MYEKTDIDSFITTSLTNAKIFRINSILVAEFVNDYG